MTRKSTNGHNLERENDNLKPGSPPRPATEPVGAAGSTRSGKTATDPGSGEPQQTR